MNPWLEYKLREFRSSSLDRASCPELPGPAMTRTQSYPRGEDPAPSAVLGCARRSPRARARRWNHKEILRPRGDFRFRCARRPRRAARARSSSRSRGCASGWRSSLRSLCPPPSPPNRDSDTSGVSGGPCHFLPYRAAKGRGVYWKWDQVVKTSDASSNWPGPSSERDDGRRRGLTSD